MMRVLISAVALAATIGAAPTAHARSLTLGEAVELGLRAEPLLSEAHIAEERAKLATLRAQLDRVSVKIDGSLQELFNKTNIGGPTTYLCTGSIAGVSFTTTTTSVDDCTAKMGTATPAPDQQWLGTFNLAANINVPIFSGLRVESNVKRAQKLRDSAAYGVRQTRKDTAISVARAYWAVRRLGLLLEVQQRTLERLTDAEAVAAARVRAGLAPAIDKNRATLRRLQQSALYADQNGQLREQTAQLAVLIGLPITEEAQLTDTPSFPRSSPPDLKALLDEARGGRPELRQAGLQIEAQKASVRIAQSGFYPQLNGLFLFQLGNNAFNPLSGARSFGDGANPFSNITGNLTAGLTLNMNFFDMLNTYTAQKDAKYELLRLGEEERRFKRVVEGDVRNTRERVAHLWAKQAPLEEAAEVARDNLKILEARYKNGDALVIEYLDGQVELASAELQLADNTAQLQLAWLELDAALGKIVGASQ